MALPSAQKGGNTLEDLPTPALNGSGVVLAVSTGEGCGVAGRGIKDNQKRYHHRKYRKELQLARYFPRSVGTWQPLARN